MNNVVNDLEFDEKQLSLIKYHLKEKNYVDAFSKENLATYTAFYTPSRSLLFLDRLKAHVSCLEEEMSIAVLGGGSGAEMVAFSIILQFFQVKLDKKCNWNIRVIDFSDYMNIFEKLNQYCKDDSLLLSFEQANVFDIQSFNYDFISICFLINELYKENSEYCMMFLNRLFSSNVKCIWFCDCASDVSSVLIKKKSYPIYFLLDYIALNHKSGWTIYSSVDSQWYRSAYDFKPPLQNIRYFERLYVRKAI